MAIMKVNVGYCWQVGNLTSIEGAMQAGYGQGVEPRNVGTYLIKGYGGLGKRPGFAD